MNIKKEFLLKSSLITALPIWVFIIPYLGVFIYFSPLVVIESILKLPKGTLVEFGGWGDSSIVSWKSFLFVIPIWLIFGYFSGLIVYKIRERDSMKKNLPINLKSNALLTVSLFPLLLVGIVIFISRFF